MASAAPVVGLATRIVLVLGLAVLLGVVTYGLVGVDSWWLALALCFFWLGVVAVVAGRRGWPRPARRTNDPVVVEIAPDEVEAELTCSLLRSSGIRCYQRQTNIAAAAWGSGNVSAGGPREVLVTGADVERAREVLDAPPVAHGRHKRRR